MYTVLAQLYISYKNKTGNIIFITEYSQSVIGINVIVFNVKKIRQKCKL